jgi:hypothetical protein
MGNDSDKSCRENQHTHFMINIFFRKSCSLWDNVEKYGTARDATDINILRRTRSACWKTENTDTHSEYVLFIAFFHCDNGYANVPQCYVYNYISSLVNNDIVQFALLIFQFSSPVNKQVANYNNSHSNKNNNNSKNLSAYPAELWRRPHLFQPKNKTRHNYSLSSRHLALGTKTWDVRNCKM